MNDLSNNLLSSAGDADKASIQLTDHLAKLSTSSICCVQLLSDAPALRAVACERLRSFLSGHRVSNPDVVFINSANKDLLESAVSLTDALIIALIQGPGVVESDQVAFYHRHDSLDPAHRYPDEDAQRFRSALLQLVETLPALYEGGLSAFWSQPKTWPAESTSTAPVKQIVYQHQLTALQREVDIHHATQFVDDQEKACLLNAFQARGAEGVWEVSLQLAEDEQWKLPVFAVRGVSTAAETAPVFLVMPGTGIERFESTDTLSEALVVRLAGPVQDKHLFQCLPMALQDRLEKGAVPAADGMRYSLMERSMLDHHVDLLQFKLTHDFGFLLSRARHYQHRHSGFLQQIDGSHPAVYHADALSHRVERMLKQTHGKLRPAWFKHAAPGRQEEYLRLESDHAQRRAAVDQIFAGIQSLEDFALGQIDEYIQTQLGYRIDPREVMVNVTDAVKLKSGEVTASYRKSLLDYAMHGLPYATGDGVVELPKGREHAAFDWRFAEDLVTRLDLQRRYADTLRTRYGSEITQRALTHLRDSELALSTWSALLQGHLLNDRSETLLRNLRGDQPAAQSQQAMGSVALAATGVTLKDAIVFRDDQAGDRHYVLYAPGAPAGRDMFEFSSWRQLSFEIGGWTATEAGARYLLDQCGDGSGNDPKAFIEAVQLKPVQWGEDSVVFSILDGENYETRLKGLINHRIDRLLHQAQQGIAGFASETSFANRRTLALIDARLEWLEKQFLASTRHMLSFEDFAKQTIRKRFESWLHESGVNERLDPDTLYFDLANSAYTATPDFGEYTQLRTLTSLMLEGHSEHFAYTPQAPMYSSIGQDLSQFPLYFVQFVDKSIREADLAAQYIDYLNDRFLDRQHADHGKRRALMGMRTQFQMRRGAILQFLAGTLDAQQYSWLSSMIVGLDKDELASNAGLRERIEHSVMSPLRVAGYTVEGVYIFRDFNTSDRRFNLLYTPNAPDGITFREVTDYADLLKTPNMRSYYYSRVPYVGQPSVGTLYEDMARGLRLDPASIRIEHSTKLQGDVITDVYALYDEMIGRMIADIDAQTTSRGERLAEFVYTVVRWTGTILFLPFPPFGFIWGVLGTGINVFRGAEAYSHGDRATALPYFAFALLGVLSGADEIRGAGQATSTVMKSLLKGTHNRALVVGRQHFAGA